MICAKLLDAGNKKARVKESFSTQNKGINVCVSIAICNFPKFMSIEK